MPVSRLLYRTLSLAGAPYLARLVRPSAPVLCFHNVVQGEETGRGDRSLHMDREHFDDILAWLSSRYHVLPLAEIVCRVREGRPVGGAAALTFDDAYRGVLRNALPLLGKRALPATVFVVTDFLERPRCTWWDTLAERGHLTAETRGTCLERYHGLHDEVAAALPEAAGTEDLPESLLPASGDEVVAAVGGDIEIGSHTSRHANLAALDPITLSRELNDSRHSIGIRFGREPESVAYPYGLWSPGVRDAARSAGYSAGFALGNRALSAGADPYAIPRINVPATISLDALACWAAGLRARRS